jgi:hypothetical protein
MSPPKLSFELPDLILLEASAAFHDFRMMIRLDFCGNCDADEELVVFRSATGGSCLCTLWRVADRIIVQMADGNHEQFESVADAVDQLVPCEP